MEWHDIADQIDEDQILAVGHYDENGMVDAIAGLYMRHAQSARREAGVDLGEPLAQNVFLAVTRRGSYCPDVAGRVVSRSYRAIDLAVDTLNVFKGLRGQSDCRRASALAVLGLL